MIVGQAVLVVLVVAVLVVVARVIQRLLQEQLIPVAEAAGVVVRLTSVVLQAAPVSSSSNTPSLAKPCLLLQAQLRGSVLLVLLALIILLLQVAGVAVLIMQEEAGLADLEQERPFLSQQAQNTQLQ